MPTIDSLKQKQAFLKVLIFSLVTIMIWVGFSIFRSQNTTSISPELLALAVPLNPNINLNVINTIKNKRQFTDNELSSFTIYKLVQLPGGQQQIVSSNPITGTVTPNPNTTGTQAPSTFNPGGTSPLGGLTTSPSPTPTLSLPITPPASPAPSGAAQPPQASASTPTAP